MLGGILTTGGGVSTVAGGGDEGGVVCSVANTTLCVYFACVIVRPLELVVFVHEEYLL